MSLKTKIDSLATRIATEFRTVRLSVFGSATGGLDGLSTIIKTSIVEAINELVTSLGNKQDSLGYTPVNSTTVGAAGGVCPLGADAKVPAQNLPSYVDDVKEYADLTTIQTLLVGEEEDGQRNDLIYVALDTNKTYRWSGSAYTVTGGDIAIGETAQTAHRGDHGKLAYDHSQVTSGNPHGVTFDELGSKPTTLAGFGITDTYSKTEVDSVIGDEANANFVTAFEAALSV